MNKFSNRQQRFCDEYIISLNATESAKLAGYSEHTAYSSGQRLLKKVEIKNYINDKLNSLQSDKIMNRNEILETYTGIARNKSNSIKDVLKALDSLSRFLVLFKEDEEKDTRIRTISWEEYLKENEEDTYKF